tara:strand:+ start:1555 stop:2718 length:1164 start_codon:yes stop_codon:yes gene_type:complete
MKFRLFDKHQQPAITFFTASSGRVIVDNGIVTTGGAEAQISYLSNMIVSMGGKVNILTANVGESKLSYGSNKINIIEIWSKRVPAPIKLIQLIHKVIISDPNIYIRGVSIAGFLIAILSRMFLKRVVVGLTSDLNCIEIPHKFWRNFWTKNTLRVCNQVIAQTEDQKELLRKNFDVRSVVLSNVICLSKFEQARKVSFDSRDIDVLWVGTVEPRKGLENLLVIAAKMPSLMFCVVGGAGPSSKDYAQDMILQSNGLDNVTMKGFVSPEQVVKWMSRSKMLLHTSIPMYGNLTKEGFPNVFLEAWASGVVVVSLHANPDEVLSSNDMGFKADSLDEASKILKEHTSKVEKWTRLSSKSLDFVSTRNAEDPLMQKRLLGILTGYNYIGS